MNSDIVDKIKKLLEVADGRCNENESHVAALKAQQLIAKYNIEESELGIEDNKVVLIAFKGPKGEQWKFTLSSIVAENFACKVFWVRNTCNYMGHEANALACKEVFNFLFVNGKRLSNIEVMKHKMMKKDTALVYDSFIEGFMVGLQSKLNEQCKALAVVVPNDVEEAYNDLMNGETPDKKGGSQTDRIKEQAYLNGVIEGRKIMATRELKGGAENV